jgi:hypothetical protein
VGHSPDTDLLEELEGRLIRVEVKTSTQERGDGRWPVHIATRGGNQSWRGSSSTSSRPAVTIYSSTSATVAGGSFRRANSRREPGSLSVG